MNTEFILFIPYTIVLALFVWFLLTLSKDLRSVKSLKAKLRHAERHPEKMTLVEKFFYGWAFPPFRSITRWSIEAFGDKFISAYYRSSGWLFTVFAAFFILGWLFLLLLNLGIFV